MTDTVANYLEGELEACQRINAALVDALQYIVQWNPTNWSCETARDKARAALALAEKE